MSGEPVYTGQTNYGGYVYHPPQTPNAPSMPSGYYGALARGSEAVSTITTPQGGVLSLAEGTTSYDANENATYVGTSQGVMRYAGKQSSVGGRFIKSGTVMTGLNSPYSEASSEAVQALKAAEIEKAQRELAVKQVAANRAAAVKGVVGKVSDLTQKLVSRVPYVKSFSESFNPFSKEKLESAGYKVEFKEEPAYYSKSFLEEQAITKAVEKKLFGKDFEGWSNSSETTGFDKNGSTKVSSAVVTIPTGESFSVLQEEPKVVFKPLPSTTETIESLPLVLPSAEVMARIEKFPSDKEYARQRAVEGFQSESESQLFGLPVIGGGLKWFEEGVSGTQKYFASHDVFGRPKDVVSSSFSSTILGFGNIIKPSTLITAAKTGGVIVEEVVNEPKQFFKRIGSGVSVVVKREETAFKTNPAVATAELAGVGAGLFLLSGGKPLGFLKYPSEASAAEAALKGGKPLSVSQGLIIGEETGKGLAVRVKAVKTLLTEKGFVDEPIDATFLGSVKESAGKQADMFIRTNKAAVSEAGGKFKVLSVEKTASSNLLVGSKSIVTGKGLRVNLKSESTNVFTRVEGAPETMVTSVGEVSGEGIVNIPKSKWRLNVGAKESFPKALEKISVRGKDIPFTLDYVSTSGGGIVEGRRVQADFADLGKGVVDASMGKAKQELFVNVRATNTPIKVVSATQDFINRHPMLLRLNVGAKESFPKALEYVRAKTRAYGKPSTEESFFKLTELGESKGKAGTFEWYSGGGRTYPNEPFAKPLRFGARTLEQVGLTKNYFFGKVKRLVTSKDNFNGGANNRPLSNSGGGASVDVNVGGGSKQVMSLGEAGGKIKEPKVFAVPLGVSEVQIRAAASKTVTDFYAKQAVKSSSLGVASAKAVTGSSKVSRNAFNVSNRSGTIQFNRTESRSIVQPLTRVSMRSGSMLENEEATRTVTRMFNVDAIKSRAVSLTGSATETRNVFSTALRNVTSTATRTATRTATLMRTQTLTRLTTITPPGGGGTGEGGGGGGDVLLPKGDVLGAERKRKRLPVKFFLKLKSKKTGRAPLSDLFNLNVTELAIRGKAHSPSVKAAEKFFKRSSGLVVPTQEQIKSKFRF